MALVPNRPTALGRQLGAQLARMADKARAQFIDKNGKIGEPCHSCAFRRGTVPNGCEETVMDAIKCVMESVPFFCHETKGNNKPLCAGWYVSQAALLGKPQAKAPWKFSSEYAEEDVPAVGKSGEP